MRGFVFINEPHNSVKRVFMVGQNMVFINSLINHNNIIYIYISFTLPFAVVMVVSALRVVAV